MLPHALQISRKMSLPIRQLLQPHAGLKCTEVIVVCQSSVMHDPVPSLTKGAAEGLKRTR